MAIENTRFGAPRGEGKGQLIATLLARMRSLLRNENHVEGSKRESLHDESNHEDATEVQQDCEPAWDIDDLEGMAKYIRPCDVLLTLYRLWIGPSVTSRGIPPCNHLLLIIIVIPKSCYKYQRGRIFEACEISEKNDTSRKRVSSISLPNFDWRYTLSTAT